MVGEDGVRVRLIVSPFLAFDVGLGIILYMYIQSKGILK